ncbi:MAG TPA: tetratricopeptide repeat protein, partial [Candidatus Limnocylindrales bacterium]|nr:tetratricopeptide repeat protein [Candidatus Limnocylindrales bacterium]
MSSVTLHRTGRPRAVGFVIAALAIVAATYVGATLRPGAGSVVPVAPAAASASSVAVGLDAGDTPTAGIGQIDHSIEAWTRNLDANPHDYIAATNLAVLYQGRGRLSYDLADYQRSLDAARQALTIEPGDVAARLAEASTLVSLHDFEAALTTA